MILEWKCPKCGKKHLTEIINHDKLECPECNPEAHKEAVKPVEPSKD